MFPFRVEGVDLQLDLPVKPWEAALGGKVKVPTLGGIVELKIPAASQQGRKLRLKGRGLPAKTPGDLYVTLQIALPPADSEKAKELYESGDYQAVLPKRLDATSNHFAVLVDGFVMPS